MIEFTGLITKAFSVRQTNITEITDGNQTFSFIYPTPLSLGRVIHIKGVPDSTGPSRVTVQSLHEFSGEELASKKREIVECLASKISLSTPELLVQNDVTTLLKPLFETAARKLLLAKSLGRYVLLKFHADADGISGAYAITSFLRCMSHQQNSAVYTSKDAIRDLNLVHHEFDPLVVLLDLGANEESKEGLELLKAAGVEVMIIDHHPPLKEIEKYVSLFVSPWATEVTQSVTIENLSAYPAGYLAVEIARIAGSKNLDWVAPVSCAGDKSTILAVTDEDRKKALVLDFLAINAGYGNNLAFYKSVLEKQELFYSILSQAREKIESISASVKKTKKAKEMSGVFVHVVDLDALSVQHEFPSRGKIATFIFEELDHSKPHVVIGVSDRTIIFRINDAAVLRGIQADHIIESLKSTHGEFILSGGGHARAAALRLREGFKSSIVDEIMVKMSNILGSDAKT